MTLWKKSKTEVENNETIQNNKENSGNTEEIALYVLSERIIQGLVYYAKDRGLCIQKCFEDIEEAKVELVLDSRPTRIIIIESGQGRFISTGIRKDIIDIIGMCDGISKKVSVFYTNSILKVDTLRQVGKKGKDIQWFNYKNTSNVVKETLELREKYILSETEEHYVDADNSMCYCGTPVKVEVSLEQKVVHNILDDIKLDKDNESLLKFNIIV